MSNKKGYIYLIKNKINGKKYIGQTSRTIKERFQEHCYSNKKYSVIDKALKKYGKHNFEIRKIEECKLKNLDEKEKYWIKKHNTFEGKGYNLTPGGLACSGKEHPMYGRKHSPETIKKIKDKVGGENHPFYNKKRPQFAKKIKGVCTGPRNGMYNNTHTKENREKISKAQKGFNNSRAKINSKIANKIIKLRKEGKKMEEIASSFDIGGTAVGEVCRGKHWTQDNVKYEIDVYKKELAKKAHDMLLMYNQEGVRHEQKELAEIFNINIHTARRIFAGNHYTCDYLEMINNDKF